MICHIYDARDKENIRLISGGKIISSSEINNKTVETWSYDPRLSSEGGLQCASLYMPGSSLEDMCPEEFRSRWTENIKKIEAFCRAFKASMVSMSDHCLFDLIPTRYTLEYFSLKEQITDFVLKKYEKPSNYDFMLGISKYVNDVKSRPLNLDLSQLNKNLHETRARVLRKTLEKKVPYIMYKIDGTRTGRLTTEKRSFPIMTLDKNYRSVIKPNNDVFLELDYNAAELRVLLALSGVEQPEQDLHEWNSKVVYRGLQTREEAKKRIFAWLYNPDSKDHLSDKAYNRGLVLEKHYSNQIVTTPFGREIEADRYHALNYLIQSTTSDMVLEQVGKISEVLEGTDSYIAFSVHDSVVVDFCKSDKEKINNLAKKFSETRFGKLPFSLKMGGDYGKMREYKI